MGTGFRAIVVMGVSGSGKTTIAKLLAERLSYDFADADEFHSASNIAKMHAGHPLTDEDRLPWLHAIADEIARRRAAGRSLTLACSALKRSYRDILVRGRRDVVILYLQVDRDVVAARMRQRPHHFMPLDLLASQYETLEEPGPDEHARTVDASGTVEETVSAALAALAP